MFFWNSPRPQKKFTIKECSRGKWAKFRKYHYLSDDLPSVARCFGVYEENNIIAFMGVLHQPHGVNKHIKRVCRLVVLPDYQGIGIATKFLEIIAKYYTNKGYDFSIVTSAKNLIYALQKNNNWTLIRYSSSSCSSSKLAIDYNRKTIRKNCKTASFFFKKNNK